MVDDELLNALGQGNIISVGPSGDVKKQQDQENIPSIELNINIEQYNHPIGIDYTKSLSPLNYITLLELTDKLLDFTNLSTECRFELETYHNYILQGKIAELREKILSLEQVEPKKIGKKGTGEQLPIILVKFLLLFLQTSPKKTIQWLPVEKINELIAPKADLKKLMKEFRQESKLTSDSMHHLLLLMTLGEILKKNLSTIFPPETLKEIQTYILMQEFSKVEKILKEKCDNRFPSDWDKSNESFVNAAIRNFKYFVD